MSNQLVNSMVRGFGMTLGRKAANAVTKQSTNQPVSLSKKKQELLTTFQDAINGYKLHLEKAINLVENKEITQTEYMILEQQCVAGIQSCELEIEKLMTAPKRSYWGLILTILSVLFLIGLLS